MTSILFDHIIAVKHGGEINANNLALSCLSYNRYKG
ncbi:MAG: HNH endonuclease [Scytonematopsis contorta HA4267-MV1]|nr:HNH endonuclease [Scytonematopsis contorta HA4267-MV1]